MSLKAIKDRSKLKHAMHKWFSENGYIEVETPLLSTTLIPEPTIGTFATDYISTLYGQRELYLVPSPEIHMKPLLRRYQQSIYQISRCFRNNEQIGSHHNPEFTMLEYYTVGCDEFGSIEITEKLIDETKLPNTKEHLLPPFNKMSVAEACYKIGKFDLEKIQSATKIREVAKKMGLNLGETLESWEDTFNRLFLNFVEPYLPQEKPLILYDYPKQIACLAKDKEGSFYKRRWELYAGGVELANCYDEETNKEKVELFFKEQSSLLATQRAHTNEAIADIDYSFSDLFDESFPQSSGVALGFDRLLMLQGNYKTLGDLILFNLSDSIKGNSSDY